LWYLVRVIAGGFMRRGKIDWRGNPNFYPHVALYDFEAWLLPYWSKIQRLAITKRTPPTTNPEPVNYGNPPAYRLQEVFRTGGHKKSYSKTIDAPRILNGEDLLVSINACTELKSFGNRIIDALWWNPAFMICVCYNRRYGVNTGSVTNVAFVVHINEPDR
jgi:hypothetical protein